MNKQWDDLYGHEKGDQIERLGRASGVKRRTGSNLIRGICGRCVEGIVTKRGSPDSQHSTVQVYCKRMEKKVPHDIMECSVFWDVKDMSLTDLAQMALIIDPRESPPGGNYA